MKRRGMWIFVTVAVVGILALSWYGFSQAKQFESLAEAGRANAAAAMKSLEAQNYARAIASFQSAQTEFEQARNILGPSWFRGIPWLGHQLTGADDLTTIGLEGSAAGAEVSQMLFTADTSSGSDGLAQLMSSSRPHLDSALTSLTVVAERSERLSTDGLVPQLADAVDQVQGLLKPVQPLLNRSHAFLDLQRYLFSADHRFLVLAQNNAQLRPSGGFIGTYGLVSLGPSGFKLERFEDVYKLPGARSDMPVPAGMGTRRVYFHLANWWIDFPSTGQTMAQLWDTVIPKQPRINGVIAIDLPAIRNLLRVFGPVSVPEVKDKLTAKNVYELLSYAVEVDKSGGKGEQGKKDAVVSLAGEVMRRLVTVSSNDFFAAMQALGASANEKHIQFYFVDSAAQSAMVAAGWSGAIEPATNISDVVAVSNAVMRRPAKSNLGVSKRLAYDVTLNSQGGASTSLLLQYTKSTKNPLGSLQDVFHNLVRVHRATGTSLTDGGRGIRTLDEAAGLPTFAHSFRLDSGNSFDLRINSDVPNALRQDSDGTWHYRLLLVKQADLLDTKVTVTVRIPDGWKLESAAAALRVTGADIEVTSANSTVTLTAPLNQDIVVEVALNPR